MKNVFENAIGLLKRHALSERVDDRQKLKIYEACARLETVSKTYPVIRQQNDDMLKADAGLEVIRDQLPFDKVLPMLQRAAETDTQLAAWLASNGGKIEQVGLAETSAFTMTDLAEVAPETAEKLRQLQTATEQVYTNLWLVKGSLNGVHKLKNFNPTGVRDVRNHLIEHTEKSGAAIFSFGISTGGPVLRPIKPSNASAAHDRGLDKNVEEFLQGIRNRLA